MGMKLFLDSKLSQEFDIVFLKTNFRKSNRNKGKIGSLTACVMLAFFAKLTYLICRHRPVLAYYPVTPVQWGWIGRDVWCLFICRLFHVKTVIHFRGSHLKLNFAHFRPWAKWMVRKACAGVSIGIVQADCLSDQFDQLLPAERIRTLYQAIDAGEYDNHDLNEYIRGKVMFIGHLTQAKGYCDLLRSIEPVVGRYPNAHFYFAGTLRRGERGVFFDQTTGNRLAYEDPFDVESQVTGGPVRDHYHNLGVVSGERKRQHLRECDVFVLPSYSEGFSRAMLEAMSMGKPVVYTPVGAHREVMQDGINGLVVSPGDHDRLVECLCTLLESRSLRDRMAAANYARVRGKFDIRVVAKQLSNILWSVIDQGRDVA
jgi:glycosyltransferase involved in cell wall biosynthesis